MQTNTGLFDEVRDKTCDGFGLRCSTKSNIALLFMFPSSAEFMDRYPYTGPLSVSGGGGSVLKIYGMHNA